jgi:hypothetical protein
MHSGQPPSHTSKADFLIAHVLSSIENAESNISKLPPEVFAIEGMSSRKVRVFLNSLCAIPNTSYLEVGVWKGSTFISSLYGNQNTVTSAIAIDDWSEFGGPEKEFRRNCENYLTNVNYHFYSQNAFTVNKSKIFNKPVTLYFYDGEHSMQNQERAFTYFNEVFDDVFIAVVDDWNWDCVKQGTFSAFNKLGYKVLFEKQIMSSYAHRDSQWWNGIYVAVISKR